MKKECLIEMVNRFAYKLNFFEPANVLTKLEIS